MIEPHSAQLGASSWILKATFVVPSESVTVPEPLPFEPVLAGAAWPLVATTASSSRAGEEAPPGLELAVAAGAFPLGADAVDAVASVEPALPDDAPFGASSVATARPAGGSAAGGASRPKGAPAPLEAAAGEPKPA